MTINEWGTRYGKKRRALDRKLLAEAEAQIPSPDDAAPRMPKPPERPTTLDRNMRLTIAKAFGRPPT